MKKILLLVSVLVLILVACTPAATPAPAPPPPVVAPTVKQIVPQKPAWQVDWEKTVAEAKKEGTLMMYTTSGTSVRNEVGKAFTDKFGINVEYIAGRGSQLSAKLGAERRAGLFLGDIYMAGATTTITVLKPAGFLAPITPLLVLPEVLDMSVYFNGEIPYVDNDKQYIIVNGPYQAMTIAYNADIIKSGEIKGYADLLDPKWKGKIAFQDPVRPGAAARMFLITSTEIMSLDYHRKLAKQLSVITADRRQHVEWMAKGKYPIALGPTIEVMADFQKAGANLKWVLPVEGSYLSAGAGNLSVIDQAPHPNAAKVFVNWLMTKEGLTLWSRASLTQTCRLDVPTDHLYPEGVRDPKVKYFNANSEDVLAKAKEYGALAKEIYGPLLN